MTSTTTSLEKGKGNNDPPRPTPRAQSLCSGSGVSVLFAVYQCTGPSRRLLDERLPRGGGGTLHPLGRNVAHTEARTDRRRRTEARRRTERPRAFSPVLHRSAPFCTVPAAVLFGAQTGEMTRDGDSDCRRAHDHRRSSRLTHFVHGPRANTAVFPTDHTESPYVFVYTHPRGRPAPSALRTGGDEAILDTRRSVQLYLAQGRVKRVHCGREL